MTRLGRVGLCGLLLMASATGAMAPVAGASETDGTLTVEVLRDFFGTGVLNMTMDVPQQGMNVDVADPAGHHVTGVTDATPDFEVSDVVKLMQAHRHGDLLQRVHCLAPGKRSTLCPR